jgi:O-antigen/teichoic acid export membrane protein
MASFIQPLHEGLGTLRVLVIAFPLLTVSTIELHVRSGRGRNREVLAINCAALCTNVGFCLALLPTIGMVGGAIALAASECIQAGLLLASASAEERALVAPAFATAGLGALLLALTGAALTRHWLPLAVLGALLTAVIVLVRMPWARTRVGALV